MKYLLISLSLLLSVVLVALFMLFTQSGNNLLKPYIQDALQDRLKQDVIVETFTLKRDFIDLALEIDHNSKLTINGSFDILAQSADTQYSIDAKNLQTPYANIDGRLHVKGKIKGNIDEFQVNGTGMALNSKIVFLTTIKEKKLQGIKLKANNIKIQKILTFLKKPIYSRGIIDVDIDVQPKEDNHYLGEADIIIHYATLDPSLLQRDFGVKIAQAITYRGTIKSKIKGTKVVSKVDIFSNIAKIETKKSQYDTKTEIFKSDFIIHIPKLAALEQNLQGDITVKGNIKKTKKDLSFDLLSNTLGGSITATGLNNTLKVDASKIALPSLAMMLKQPRYSDGELNLSLDMQDLKAKEGRMTLHVKSGTLHTKELLDKQKDIIYDLSIISDIAQNSATIDSHFTSDELELYIVNANYDLSQSIAKGPYTLHVADLNRLKFLTNRALKGELQVDGNFIFDKQLYADGVSSFLDANSHFTLQESTLHVRSDKISVQKVTDMLYYPNIFDSSASLKADYNLTSKIGTINLNALHGKLIKNNLTDIIYLASQSDLTKEIYKDIIFRGLIDKKSINFSLLMNSSKSYFKIPNGNLNLKTNKIQSKFDIKIAHRDFKGTIQGDLENPKVKLSDSEYLKQKINKAIEKNIPKEWQNTAKELLKIFN